MTGQSLFYMGETNLKHKILAIAEAWRSALWRTWARTCSTIAASKRLVCGGSSSRLRPSLGHEGQHRIHEAGLARRR